jgi:hypothetical protein
LALREASTAKLQFAAVPAVVVVNPAVTGSVPSIFHWTESRYVPVYAFTAGPAGSWKFAVKLIVHVVQPVCALSVQIVFEPPKVSVIVRVAAEVGAANAHVIAVARREAFKTFRMLISPRTHAKAWTLLETPRRRTC